MKMHLKTLLLAGILFSAFTSYCQVNAESPVNKRICLLNKYNSKVRFFKQNQRIKFRIKDKTEIQKGRITFITDSTITVNDAAFSIKEFSMIGGRPLGLTAAKIIGGTLVAGGTAFMAGGVILLAQARSETEDDWVAFFNGFFGVILVATGGTFTLVGVVPLIISMKKFDLERYWTLRIIQKD